MDIPRTADPLIKRPISHPIALAKKHGDLVELETYDYQVEARTREMIAAADENLQSIISSLAHVRRKLEAGDCNIAEAEMRRTLGGVHKAVQAVFDERKKLDDIRKAKTGIVKDYALDFRLAEEEIRSRLARIRADLHAGEVSQVAE